MNHLYIYIHIVMMDNIDELFLLYPLQSRLQVSPVILAFLDFLYDVARRHDVSPKGGLVKRIHLI